MVSTSRYSSFGISMERRSSRRWLVGVTYFGLVLLCAINIAYVDRMGMWLAGYGAVLVGIYVFGGNGSYGLIKSFTNKPPRPIDTGANPVISLLYPQRPDRSDELSWLNDERELGRRNLAHYRAHQVVTLLLVPIVLLGQVMVHANHWGLDPLLLAKCLFAASLMATVVALTLPAAIILWTDPDIETN